MNMNSPTDNALLARIKDLKEQLYWSKAQGYALFVVSLLLIGWIAFK